METRCCKDLQIADSPCSMFSDPEFGGKSQTRGSAVPVNLDLPFLKRISPDTVNASPAHFLKLLIYILCTCEYLRFVMGQLASAMDLGSFQFVGGPYTTQQFAHDGVTLLPIFFQTRSGALWFLGVNCLQAPVASKGTSSSGSLAKHVLAVSPLTTSVGRNLHETQHINVKLSFVHF